MHGQLALQRKLNEALTNARLRNRAYSLRAFARKLEISPAALSEILNGKRNVSKRLAERLVGNLVLPPTESRAILDLFPEPGESRRAAPSSRSQGSDPANDQFHVISEWFHYAILSLAETSDFRPDANWISARLNIKATDAQAALSRLERLRMLAPDSHGALRPTGLKIQAPEEVRALATRKAHSQNLDLAGRSLERDSSSERDFTGITMAIDVAKIPQAKRMIREFREQLSRVLEDGARNEVYKLCIQLIPLTHSRPSVTVDTSVPRDPV
jgi:transcriptional regulator with XRE-family HTH domain